MLFTGVSVSAATVDENTLEQSAEKVVFATTGADDIEETEPEVAQPQGLKVKERTTSSITLTWNVVDGADKYNVYKDDEFLTAVAGNITSYTVDYLAEGEISIYSVVACRTTVLGDQESEPVTIKAATMPGEVKNVKATNIKTNSITVTWSKLAHADGYHIYKKDRVSGLYARCATVGSDVTSWTDAKAEAGYEARYAVRAYCTCGSVAELESYNYSVLITAAKPNKVTYISGEGMVENSVKLSWNKPAGGRTGYAVYRAVGSGEYKQIATLGANATSYTDKSLSAQKLYKYMIKAYTTSGSKVYSDNSPVKKVITRPSNVSSVSVSNNTSSSITVKWSKQGSAKGYQIYRKAGSGSFVKVATINNNNTLTWTDKNVKGCTTYTYRVNPFATIDGKTVVSTGKSITEVAGLARINFNTSTLLSKVKLTWSKNSYASLYEIFYSTSQNGSYTKLGQTTGTSFVTKKLTAGKTYYFRVRACKNLYGKRYNGNTYTKSRKAESVAYGKSVPSTYVEISIDSQHMWYYVDGKLYCDTDVVTGNYKTHDTTKGYHKIISKSSPATLVGPGYETVVNYWMAVTYDGIGIHDSTWRTSGYGGSIYKGDGSHGCINTPYSVVKKMYNKMKVNTPVIIY